MEILVALGVVLFYYLIFYPIWKAFSKTDIHPLPAFFLILTGIFNGFALGCGVDILGNKTTKRGGSGNNGGGED